MSSNDNKYIILYGTKCVVKKITSHEQTEQLCNQNKNNNVDDLANGLEHMYEMIGNDNSNNVNICYMLIYVNIFYMLIYVPGIFFYYYLS